MTNRIVLVGRLETITELKEEESDRKVAKLTLAVSRSWKNVNGEYETDFIDCILWNGIAENTLEYCEKGDIVGVKGRLQSKIVDDKNEMVVVAEKVSFLSNKKVGEE